MNYSEQEVLQYVGENDVKFIRLAFCDIFGEMHNVSVLSGELASAFKKGMPFTPSFIRGFEIGDDSDLLLFPDPSTLTLLPWRPQRGRVVRLLCDIRHIDGTPFAGDGRRLLASVVKKAEEKGISCLLGPRTEFYLFKTDEDGEPTNHPFDHAGYLDIAPLDRCENIRRDICLSLEEMGLHPQHSYHENGPGQNQIDFKACSPLEAADNLVTLKMATKTIAGVNGLYASFMPKPIDGCHGNGLHLKCSVMRDGKDLFNDGNGEMTDQGRSFVAGVMRRLRETTLFFNPVVSSYKRIGAFEAPRAVTWSYTSHPQMIKLSRISGVRWMQLRSPDAMCNPYIAFTLLISAGLEGIEEELELCAPTDVRLDGEGIVKAGCEVLPDNLFDAVSLAEKSDFVRKILPMQIYSAYENEKRASALGASAGNDEDEL